MRRNNKLKAVSSLITLDENRSTSSLNTNFSNKDFEDYLPIEAKNRKVQKDMMEKKQI